MWAGVGWCGFSSLVGKGRIGGNGHNKNKKEEVGWVVGREETRNLGGAIVWLVQWGVVAKYRIQKIQHTRKVSLSGRNLENYKLDFLEVSMTTCVFNKCSIRVEAMPYSVNTSVVWKPALGEGRGSKPGVRTNRGAGTWVGKKIK